MSLLICLDQGFVLRLPFLGQEQADYSLPGMLEYHRPMEEFGPLDADVELVEVDLIPGSSGQFEACFPLACLLQVMGQLLQIAKKMVDHVNFVDPYSGVYCDRLRSA